MTVFHFKNSHQYTHTHTLPTHGDKWIWYANHTEFLYKMTWLVVGPCHAIHFLGMFMYKSFDWIGCLKMLSPTPTQLHKHLLTHIATHAHPHPHPHPRPTYTWWQKNMICKSYRISVQNDVPCCEPGLYHTIHFMGIFMYKSWPSRMSSVLLS